MVRFSLYITVYIVWFVLLLFLDLAIVLFFSVSFVLSSLESEAHLSKSWHKNTLNTIHNLSYYL